MLLRQESRVVRQESRVGHGTQREDRLFTACVAVGMLHAVDDALLNRQPGVPVTQHLLALLAVTVGAALGVFAFPRMRPGLRSALALVAGSLMATNGAMHVLQAFYNSIRGSDWTGMLAAAAGLVLVALAAYIPFHHRGELPLPVGRRWARRGFAVVTGVIASQFVLAPFLVAVVQTHKYREDVGEPPAGFAPVAFSSTDDLRLSGRYRPSQNGAAVVIVNSARGDRKKSGQHAELLGRHGEGVLMYDAGGPGQSDGAPKGWGWEWEHDVAGAVDFLQTRPEVEDDRIGGLGLSTGADVLIEVAAKNPDMRAVVGDGATQRSFADRPPGVQHIPLAFTMVAAGQLFSGTSPGEPLVELIAEAAPTPILLVAAGSMPMELSAGDRYAAAGSSTSLLRLPEVAHTEAIREVPALYERRVIGHLDAALLGR